MAGPNGNTEADATDPIADIFGTIEQSAHPDLAQVGLRAKKAAGEDFAKAVDQAAEGDTDTADEPEVQEDQAKPDAESGSDGKDQESPADTESVIQSLLDELGASEKVRTVRGTIDKLVTGSDAEKVAARKDLERMLDAFAEAFEDGPSGPTLKIDVAARTLAMHGKTRRGPETDEQIRHRAESEYRTFLSELLEPADVDAAMKTKHAQERVKAREEELLAYREAQAEAAMSESRTEIAGIVQSHLKEHPKDAEIMPAVGKFLEGFPPELRQEMVRQGWFPFSRLCRIVRIEQELPKLMTRAFQMGQESKQKSVRLSGTGAPSGLGPPRQKTASQRSNDAFRDAIMGVSSPPGIDSIMERRR